MPERRVKEMIGLRYGQLLITKFVSTEKRVAKWLALCDCGNEKVVVGAEVRRGNVISCGCRRLVTGYVHGLSYTPEYKAWDSMMQRCNNPNHAAYKHYGGRGIEVCERWLQVENFYADMGVRPKGLSLERINNSLGYSPENCKWATWIEQANNRRKRLVKKVNK